MNAPPAGSALETLRERLASHPLYDRLRDERALRGFMELHVFAVWDFLGLLKELQRRLTCVSVPWVPRGDPRVRRMINEIVLDEESDLGPDGEPVSHLELYLEAMDRAGADAAPVRALVAAIASGKDARVALGDPTVPCAARSFVTATLDATQAPDHELAAVFAYGREEIIPEMFREVVARLAHVEPERWSHLVYYLERHIERDGDTHARLAHELVVRLCDDDPAREAAARSAATRALAARIELWDAIAERIGEHHER